MSFSGAGGAASPQKERFRTLEAAIKAEVRAEVDLLQGEALAQVQRIQREAEAQSALEREKRLQEAASEAAIVGESAVARAQLEAQRLKVLRREQLLTTVFAAAAQRLPVLVEAPDYAETAAALVRDAVRRLNVRAALVVRADTQTCARLDAERLAALSAELGAPLTLGAPLEVGVGVVVETPDGHRRYDNTLSARLDRMRDALRAPVYHILMGDKP
ncbi:MAG: V-type ATP synthase subunit E family protein [Anaerolineae bacterium]|jgi:vacuolar-type H+-ATPase subunit E/Vma4|nr:V-type ATP synthase subunit E family protein [Anaerolineae bacterium]